MKISAILSRFLKSFTTPIPSERANFSRRKRRKAIAGFTIIELLVVIAIVAVLAAIAAPSWLSFVNNQRISQVNQQVFQSIQEAQRQAKRTKIPYSVSFKVDSNFNGVAQTQPTAQVAIHLKTTRASDPNLRSWAKLGEERGVQPAQIFVYTNLEVNSDPPPPTTQALVSNRVSSSLSTNNYRQPTLSNSQGPVTITFDAEGILDPLSRPSLTMGTPPASRDGLIIGVGVPNNVNPTPTAPIERTLRCVVVKTLLGSMELQQGELCRPWA